MPTPDQLERKSSFIPTMQGFQADPRVQYPILDEQAYLSLKHTFERWSNKGDPNGFIGREIGIQSEQIGSLTTSILYDYLRFNETEHPYLFLTHAPMRTTAEKTTLFKADADLIASFLQSTEIPQAVVTVTVKIPQAEKPPKRILVTTIDGKIDNHAESNIAADLSISKKMMKKRVINPRDINPEVLLGTKQGMIGPFIPAPAIGNFDGFYYIENEYPSTTPVEIAISDKDSLLVQMRTFEQLLEMYGNMVSKNGYYKKISIVTNK